MLGKELRRGRIDVERELKAVDKLLHARTAPRSRDGHAPAAVAAVPSMLKIGEMPKPDHNEPPKGS